MLKGANQSEKEIYRVGIHWISGLFCYPVAVTGYPVGRIPDIQQNIKKNYY